ncbi:hypothetical protein BGX26_006179 [Mortierella sp. AD094]|nr:hypothetical protein BGX26_006179 [Mortierella sp. AD094]
MLCPDNPRRCTSCGRSDHKRKNSVFCPNNVNRRLSSQGIGSEDEATTGSYTDSEDMTGGGTDSEDMTGSGTDFEDMTGSGTDSEDMTNSYTDSGDDGPDLPR